MPTDQMQAAYITFAYRIGLMLVRKGAQHTDYYYLRTAAGTLIMRVSHNSLFGRFENPIAGFILTHGLCHQDSGFWSTNFAIDVKTLTDESTIHHAEIELDSFLTRTFDEYEQTVIEHVDKYGLAFRDVFLANFYRLKSVSMAARETVNNAAIASLTLPANNQAAPTAAERG